MYVSFSTQRSSILVAHTFTLADTTGDFGNISLAQVSSTDELEEYLRQPNESVKDPLKWWNENKTKYPNLYRMALDYLSIPREYPCFPSPIKVRSIIFPSSNFNSS